MARITVFTPTYNRAHLLHRCYESLQRQTCKDFIWLIIDDGSDDSTGQLVEKWQIADNPFEIRYVYKVNGGLHTGYNAAIERLDTELAVCIDSDDYLTDSAIERILQFWDEYGSESVAGIVALDGIENGTIIGDPLPAYHQINLIDLLIGKYRIKNGDRKLVIRSSLYQEVAPQKTFPGEKNFNPHYMHLQISKNYDFLVLNEVLCIVDYQSDGMTNSIIKQYYNSPRSFAETRRLYLSFENTSLLFRFRQCIHYVSSSLLAGDIGFLSTSPAKVLTFTAIPFGFILSLYIKHKAKSTLI